MAQPREGGKFRFEGEGPLGVDANALQAGTVVTVREVVDASTPGAHDDNEDAAVIEWEAPVLVQGDGGPEVGYVTRAMSVGVDWFNDNFKTEK